MSARHDASNKSLHEPPDVSVTRLAVATRTPDTGVRELKRQADRKVGHVIEVILKRFDTPDEVTQFELGSFETVTLGGMTIGRATYQPGWKWSKHVGPGIGERYCRVEHVGMVVSGCATAAFADGRVTEMKPGDVFHVPSEPHDSWVVGDEPYVSLHFLGAGKYAKGSA